MAHTTRTYADRILRALARVYEDPNATVTEVIQAARLASDILERRPKVRRKTAKERLVEEALGKKKGVFPAKKNALPPEEGRA